MKITPFPALGSLSRFDLADNNQLIQDNDLELLFNCQNNRAKRQELLQTINIEKNKALNTNNLITAVKLSRAAEQIKRFRTSPCSEQEDFLQALAIGNRNLQDSERIYYYAESTKQNLLSRVKDRLEILGIISNDIFLAEKRNLNPESINDIKRFFYDVLVNNFEPSLPRSLEKIRIDINDAQRNKNYRMVLDLKVRYYNEFMQ